jgi:hypothetical protein
MAFDRFFRMVAIGIPMLAGLFFATAGIQGLTGSTARIAQDRAYLAQAKQIAGVVERFRQANHRLPGRDEFARLGGGTATLDPETSPWAKLPAFAERAHVPAGGFVIALGEKYTPAYYASWSGETTLITTDRAYWDETRSAVIWSLVIAVGAFALALLLWRRALGRKPATA